MNTETAATEPTPTPSPAWPAFERRLAEALETLEEDQYLVISEKRGSAFVQFAAQGSFGLRAESVSNSYLPESDALGDDQIAALEKLGWSSPTGKPREATPERQPDGSPNFFRDFERPVPFGDVARLAVRTLTEVHGIPHPGFLDYQAFERNGPHILIPTLGLKHRLPAPPPKKPRADTVESVRALVLKAIRKASGISDLEFGEDGRLHLRFGSAAVFVRVQTDPVCVGIFSPVLADIEANDRLLDRLNDLNARFRFVRLFWLDGTIFAAAEVSTSPFVAEHVTDACRFLGGLADDIDETLQQEFGGCTAFGEVRSELPVQ